MLRVAALAALLVGAPALAAQARAQQASAIHAAAMVINSIMDAGLQRDSAGAAPLASRGPDTRRLLIVGIGVVSVQAGEGQAVRIARGVAAPRCGSAVVVDVFYVGS